MANVEKIIPFIIRWEAGVIAKTNESNEDLFNRARKRGTTNDPLDRGGLTVVGLTIGAYQAWCAQHHISKPTADNLKNIPYKTWLAILKENYWDAVKGDLITSQSIANIIFDWAWASGRVTASKKVQNIVGAVPDGIIGMKTIAAINGKSPLSLFGQIKDARLKFCDAIVRNNPSQAKWLKGWKNRINDIKFVG